MNQRTLKSEIEFQGKGLHTGTEVRARILPAPANSGIQFCRVDLAPELKVRASIDRVRQDELRQTALVVGDGVVRTVEVVGDLAQACQLGSDPEKSE